MTVLVRIWLLKMARRLFTLASSLLIVVCATSIEETTTAKISTPPFDLVVTPQTKQLNETTTTPYKKIEDSIRETTSTGINGHAQTKESTLLGLLKGTAQTTRPGMVIGQ